MSGFLKDTVPIRQTAFLLPVFTYGRKHSLLLSCGLLWTVEHSQMHGGVSHTKPEQHFWPGTSWPESESELYRPSDRRLSAKLAPNFAGRGCHVVSATDP
jgi:hypothetical protein